MFKIDPINTQAIKNLQKYQRAATASGRKNQKFQNFLPKGGGETKEVLKERLQLIYKVTENNMRY